MERVIITHWSITDVWTYVLYALGLTLAVRVIANLLRGLEQAQSFSEFRAAAWVAFKGFDKDPMKGDRWLAFILGFIEFMIYPFLMSAGLWLGVGGWLTLKTVAQWKSWEEHRSVFNRFLIGNALVVALAFICLAPKVSLKIKPPEKEGAANVQQPIHSEKNSTSLAVGSHRWPWSFARLMPV